MRAAGILVAAGRGERLGGHGPKALVRVAGRTLLAHGHARLTEAGLAPVVVVHPSDHAEAFAREAPGAWLAPGGATRTDSVRAGVALLGDDALDDVEAVAIHDAARSLTPVEVIVRTVAAVRGDVLAAAPGLPVADTLKEVAGDEVMGTVERSDLLAIQTPQVVRRDVLVEALATGTEATDDLGLVEALLASGARAGRLVTVPGSARGMKVTYPEDVALIEALCRAPA